MNNKAGLIILLIVIMGILTGAGYAQERNDNGYFTIIDEQQGNVVFVTGWKIEVGDQFLTDNNRRYEITRLEQDTAYAKFIGDVNLSGLNNDDGYPLTLNSLLTPAIAQGTGKVAIYHTHSDESYVPSDGSESILGQGGIYKVGDTFTTALQAKGMQVIHSLAKHDPHDDMAYERSRRTVVDLLKQQPDAIFDVHRDSTPPEVYKTTIDGQDATKVQLVVGKYGPTGKQIEDYALQIKAASDNRHPGLIKGIFFAKGGDYNQDLHPRSMLLEVGAHTNDRQAAEHGIALFADIVPTILGKPTTASPTDPAASYGLGTTASGPSGASKAIGWIIGVVVVGAAIFLFVSTGSMREARAKLKQFTATEFANFFGPKLNKKPPQDYSPTDEEKTNHK